MSRQAKVKPISAARARPAKGERRMTDGESADLLESNEDVLVEELEETLRALERRKRLQPLDPQ